MANRVDPSIAGFNGRGLKHVPAKQAPEHVPAKWNPVRQGEPLFADKNMRQPWNLRRFPLIWVHCVNLVHRVIPYQRKTP